MYSYQEDNVFFFLGSRFPGTLCTTSTMQAAAQTKPQLYASVHEHVVLVYGRKHLLRRCNMVEMLHLWLGQRR